MKYNVYFKINFTFKINNDFKLIYIFIEINTICIVYNKIFTIFKFFNIKNYKYITFDKKIFTNKICLA